MKFPCDKISEGRSLHINYTKVVGCIPQLEISSNMRVLKLVETISTPKDYISFPTIINRQKSGTDWIDKHLGNDDSDNDKNEMGIAKKSMQQTSLIVTTISSTG